MILCQFTQAQVKVLDQVKTSRSSYASATLMQTVRALKLQQKNVEIVLSIQPNSKKESFRIEGNAQRISITGNDASGVLYGC